MVTSGYSMDLYCDCTDCEKNNVPYDLRNRSTGVEEFSGETYRECLRDAKRVGWTFFNSNTGCYAPGHAPARSKNA